MIERSGVAHGVGHRGKSWIGWPTLGNLNAPGSASGSQDAVSKPPELATGRSGSLNRVRITIRSCRSAGDDDVLMARPRLKRLYDVGEPHISLLDGMVQPIEDDVREIRISQ